MRFVSGRIWQCVLTLANMWFSNCVGNQTPVVELVTTWHTGHGRCVVGVTVFWSCVVSFMLRPLDHMAVTTETNCCRCFQSDRQLCCDARTCELCVGQTRHQIVRSSGQDAPQLVDRRFDNCVCCRSPAEA